MRNRAGYICTVLLVVILLPECLSIDQETRISCFILGKVQASLCPFTSYFQEDPLFVYSLEPIPSGLTNEERRRYDRQYFPRTRSILVDSIDMMFFSDARVQHFMPRQFSDLDYAFRDAGMPSYWSFGPAWIQAIEPTILYQLLPVSEYDFYFHKNWKVVFREGRDPVLTPFKALGMEKVQGDAYAKMVPRPGAEIWADMEPVDFPWLVSWEPGGSNPGIAWVCGDEFNQQWWALTPGSRHMNPYAIDMTTNMILYSLGRDLVRDIQARRAARELLSTFKAQKLLILSMIEWADGFGANVLSVSSDLTDLEADVEESTSHYLNQEYTASITLMDALDTRVVEITREAVRLKDEAMFWVFLSEWLAVTSATLLSGIVVWTLMVRRRLYRSVTTTRMTRNR